MPSGGRQRKLYQLNHDAKRNKQSIGLMKTYCSIFKVTTAYMVHCDQRLINFKTANVIEHDTN